MNTQATPERVCPACGSTHRQIKAGKTGAGKPHLQCRDCKRPYVLNPQPRGLDPSLRRMAIRLYLEGNGFCRIARLLGVNHQTVVNWVRTEEAAQAPAPVPRQTDVVELDELYAFHQRKGSGCSSRPA